MNFLENLASFAKENTTANPLVERYEKMAQGGKYSYFESNDFEEIIEHYLTNMEVESALLATQFAIERFPDDEHFMMMRAIALLESRRFDEAMALIRRVEKTDKDNLDVLHIKAIATIASGHTDKGLSLLDKLLRRTDGKNEKLRVLIPAINYLQFTKANDAALKYALKLHSIIPENQEAALMLARCLKNCGDIEQSIAVYKTYLKTDSDEDVWLELGKAYEEDRQPREAMKIYNKVIRKNPDNIAAYWHKASIYADKNNYKEIEKLHTALLERHPDFVPGWYTKGRCYADMDRPEEAMQCYHKALELDPHYADAYFAMAMLMMTRQKTKLQMEYIQRALALDPCNQGYYLCYVNALMGTDRRQDAEGALEHCLMISDTFTPAWILLSDIHASESYARAAATLKRAQELLPDDMRIASHLAVMLYKNGNMPQCWEQIKRILQASPRAALEFLSECPDASINTEFLHLLCDADGKN